MPSLIDATLESKLSATVIRLRVTCRPADESILYITYSETGRIRLQSWNPRTVPLTNLWVARTRIQERFYVELIPHD